MLAVSKTAGATLANGALQLVYQSRQGILTDISAASFQIWDEDFANLVYPSSGFQALNVTTDRAGLGRYNATWAPGTASIGLYNVRWSVTPVGGSASTFDQQFELVPAAYKGPHYCFIQDLRDQGLLLTTTDRQAQDLIVKASRFVEYFTGRTFDPRYSVIEFDGRDSRATLLDEPIVAIEKVLLDDETLDLTEMKIYNRHISQGLVAPDDRNCPKIEFIHGEDVWGRVGTGYWPRGVRNIQITGMFGYTESDTSFTGQTPAMVREATKMLAFENLPKLASGGAAARGPIIRERTRDQEVDFAPLRVTGMTGNRSIDVLLAGFRREPGIGST